MRAIWKGAISFGLVNIPIALFPATRREELKFHLLRKSDHSPVNYKRVAAADGKEVPWDEIVKGYEYEKGKFVVLQEEDFARVDIEATQTVDITDFVALDQVDPMYFYKPYFMEPAKGGEKSYNLLHQALEESGKIGIAKVVIKTRQYLAAVKPEKRGLILELMHFAEELLDAKDLKIPERQAGKQELKMARALVDGMTSEWKPDQYHDDYREKLEQVIEEKLEHPQAHHKAAARTSKPTKVIDLVAVLQKSIEHATARRAPKSAHHAHKGKPHAAPRKRAA
jgi:DNA end-binding protein Ku